MTIAQALLRVAFANSKTISSLNLNLRLDTNLRDSLRCYRLLVIHFDLEAQVFDHAPDFGGRLAWCREVAVHEDGVSWIESERLQTAEIIFAATGNADFGARVQEPEEAEHFQAALRGELVAML